MKKIGRPEVENKRDVKLQIRVTQEENERINELAKKMGISKTKLIRNLLLADLVDAEFLNKWKILPIAKKLISFSEGLKGVDYESELKKESE